jgi:hypothetical protein
MAALPRPLLYAFILITYSDSARKTLKHIMHPGDSLARDETGERFDGGVAASWATRSHRMFTAHSVAVSATRAVYRAASREIRRTKTPSSPPSAKPALYVRANFMHHAPPN